MMLKKWTLHYPGLTGVQKRRVYVYLPNDYYENTDRRYPVLYMFDGQNVFLDKDATFGKSWGMMKYLNRSHTQLIVAAIESNPAPDNARLSEYCPFDWEDRQFGFFEGHGEDTMRFYIRRFKPYIDKHFRTIPDRDHTFIGGSSMGGLMSLYAVTWHNRVFSRALCFSPTLDANVDTLSEIINEAEILPDTVIYMDYGTEEFENEPFQPDNYLRIHEDLFRRGIFVSSRVVPYGDHSEESWERQLPFAIPTLLYP